MGGVTITVDKFLLPSAVHLEERLTVSQSVSDPGQQSVTQKHTVWAFCQWQTRLQVRGCRKKMNAHRLPLILWPKTRLHQTQLEDPKAYSPESTDWAADDEVLEEWQLKNALGCAERRHKSQTAP